MATKNHSEILTIAAVRKPKKEGLTEYLFNEKQQIFTFTKEKKRNEELEYQLGNAFRKNRPVEASIDLKRSQIKSISTLTTKQKGRFLEGRKFLKKPASHPSRWRSLQSERLWLPRKSMKTKL